MPRGDSLGEVGLTAVGYACGCWEVPNPFDDTKPPVLECVCETCFAEPDDPPATTLTLRDRAATP